MTYQKHFCIGWKKMWFFDVFHFLYNTKMYRFCNGQISAPCHRNSEHRRIGLIGWILIQKIFRLHDLKLSQFRLHSCNLLASQPEQDGIQKILDRGNWSIWFCLRIVQGDAPTDHTCTVLNKIDHVFSYICRVNTMHVRVVFIKVHHKEGGICTASICKCPFV